MKFTIVGAGALGSILGAHLIAAGVPVRMLARGQRASQVAEQGLRIRGLIDLDVPCEVVTRVDHLEDDELLVFAVKTYHMDEAIRATDHLRPGCVFSMANGVMKNDQLANAFGADAVSGCMANFSGELASDGSVLFTRNVKLFIGDTPAGGRASAAVINAAGIHAQASDAIETIEWSKFVGWVALFSLSVISRTETWRALLNEPLAGLAVSIIKETAGIAESRGIALIDQSPMPVKTIAESAFDAAVEKVRDVGRELQRNAPDHRMSSLQDLLAGRPLEVEETLGYALREAKRLGLSAPALASCHVIGAGLDQLRRG